MAAAKGTRPSNAGKGRPAGSRNKLTVELKDAIDSAFVALGGEEYLVKLGRENPQAFVGLLGKRLPKELTGLNGASLTVQVLQFGDPRLADSSIRDHYKSASQGAGPEVLLHRKALPAGSSGEEVHAQQGMRRMQQGEGS